MKQIRFKTETAKVILAAVLTISIFHLTKPSALRADENKPDTPKTSQIIGGTIVDLTSSPIALIVTPETLCSGTLIAPNLVLTAAHCLFTPSDLPVTTFLVFLGNSFYTVSQGFYNSGYSDFAPIMQVLPYDLGILVLTSNVAGVTPLPVLYDWNLIPGDKILIYGYGSNEMPYNPAELTTLGRGAQVTVDRVYSGYFTSTHIASGASTCHGDSGGLAMYAYGNYLFAAGVVSAGTNQDGAGDICTLGGPGESDYVDLQSQSSQDFLSGFNGISYLSGRLAVIHTDSMAVEQQLNDVLKIKKTREAKKLLKSILQTLKGLKAIAYPKSKRQRLIKKALKFTKAAKKSRDRKGVKKGTRKALRQVKKLTAMGAV